LRQGFSDNSNLMIYKFDTISYNQSPRVRCHLVEEAFLSQQVFLFISFCSQVTGNAKNTLFVLSNVQVLFGKAHWRIQPNLLVLGRPKLGRFFIFIFPIADIWNVPTLRMGWAPPFHPTGSAIGKLEITTSSNICQLTCRPAGYQKQYQPY
jgi:hypothetical protein